MRFRNLTVDLQAIRRLGEAYRDPKGVARHLDVNTDGKVDQADAKILDRLAAAADQPDAIDDGVPRTVKALFARVDVDESGDFDLSNVPKQSLVSLRVAASYAATHARYADALGSATRGSNNDTVVGTSDVPAGGQIRSDELFAALDDLDVSKLQKRGLRAVATFDFDKTLMADDVFGHFMELLGVRDVLTEDGRDEMVRELKARLPADHPLRAKLATLDAKQLLGAAVKAHHEDHLDPAGLYFVGVAAMTGMLESDATQLAGELFETGAPGRAPYKTHAFDLGPGEGDSAKELVARMHDKGVDAYIITAGLEMLAGAGAPYLGVPRDRVIGGRLLTNDEGRFTGEVFDVASTGKDNVLMKEIGVPPLFAFGDSLSTDGPMMRMSLVRGFVVHTRDEFREHVDSHGIDHTHLRYRK